MDVTKILAELRQERIQLEEAILSLERLARGRGRRRGRPPAWLAEQPRKRGRPDRKSTRLNSSHLVISYAVFCLKKKKKVSEHEKAQTGTHCPIQSSQRQDVRP